MRAPRTVSQVTNEPAWKSCCRAGYAGELPSGPSFAGFGPKFAELVPGGEAVQHPGVFGWLRFGQTSKPAFGPLHRQHSVEQRGQGRVDAARAVIQQRGEPVGEGASGAEPSGEQGSFNAAAVAGEVAGDPRTVAADRHPCGVAARQQPFGPAAGAGSMCAVALSKQVRQIGPSDQLAAFAACRLQQAQLRICQRSTFSRVS